MTDYEHDKQVAWVYLAAVAAIFIVGILSGCSATHLHHPLDPPCPEGHYYVQYENCRCAQTVDEWRNQ